MREGWNNRENGQRDEREEWKRQGGREGGRNVGEETERLDV